MVEGSSKSCAILLESLIKFPNASEVDALGFVIENPFKVRLGMVGLAGLEMEQGAV